MYKSKRQTPLRDAVKVAYKIVKEVETHCERIEVLGSIRRLKAGVSDIDILCIPRTFFSGGFGNIPTRTTGFIEAVLKYPKIKGDPEEGKFCQRLHEETGMHIEIYMCNKDNWGLMSLIRTGPKDFSKYIIGTRLRQHGYRAVKGQVLNMETNEPVAVPEEEDMFKLMGLGFIRPAHRAGRG